MRYLLLSLVGSLLFLLGVAVVYSAAGTLAWPLLPLRPPTRSPCRIALALMSTGLSSRPRSCPLHFWLPPAHAGAPAPASACCPRSS
jgi:multicomponent Na+:H+ antiporter subunit D